MKLSLSVRIAETATKDRLTIPFSELAGLGRRSGYHALCMRPSVAGVRSTAAQLAEIRRIVDGLGMPVSMVTADLNVPLNNDHGPDSLRDIGPSIGVAAALSANLIRVCLKHAEDIAAAQRAADLAAKQGVRLAHQCHTDSLFETVPGILDVLSKIGRSNFGIIYEPANLMVCGEPYGRDVLQRLAPHLMNVYVQNHRLNPAGKSSILTRARGTVRYDLIPLWERGGVDFTTMFEGLAKIGYAGYVTVHQAYAEIMRPVEAAERSAEFLRKMGPFDPAGPLPHPGDG
jgi:sugar phosphate isomerase/epimerase